MRLSALQKSYGSPSCSGFVIFADVIEGSLYISDSSLVTKVSQENL